MIHKCAEDHFRWIGIMADRIICSKNRKNEFPLLSLSFIKGNHLLKYFSKLSRPTFPITVEILSNAKIYGIVVSAIVSNEHTKMRDSNIQHLYDFDIILNSLLNEGYIPQKPCDSNGLKEGILEQHINLCKSIEFLVVDKSLNTTLLLSDLHYLPHSFFVLKSDVQIIHLDDAVSLWLSKFHCNSYFSDEIIVNETMKGDKNYHIQMDTSKFSKITACLARVFPEKIDVDEIFEGNNEEEIRSNIKLSRSILDEIHAFVIEKFPTDENLFYLFISDLFYATRSGVNKFVQINYPQFQLHQPSGCRSPRSPRRIKKIANQTIVKNPPKIVRPKIDSKSQRNSMGYQQKDRSSWQDYDNDQIEQIEVCNKKYLYEFPEIEINFNKLIEKFPQNEEFYRKIFDIFLQVYQDAIAIDSPCLPEILMFTNESFKKLLDGDSKLNFDFFKNELKSIFEKESNKHEKYSINNSQSCISNTDSYKDNLRFSSDFQNSSESNIKLKNTGSCYDTDTIHIVDDFEGSSESNIKLKNNDSYDTDIVRIIDIESSSENNLYNKLLKKFGYDEIEKSKLCDEEEEEEDANYNNNYNNNNNNNSNNNNNKAQKISTKISNFDSIVGHLRQYGSTFTNRISFKDLLAECQNKNDFINQTPSNVELADNESETDDELYNKAIEDGIIVVENNRNNNDNSCNEESENENEDCHSGTKLSSYKNGNLINFNDFNFIDESYFNNNEESNLQTNNENNDDNIQEYNEANNNKDNDLHTYNEKNDDNIQIYNEDNNNNIQTYIENNEENNLQINNGKNDNIQIYNENNNNDLQPCNEKSRDNIQIYDEENNNNDLQPYNEKSDNNIQIYDENNNNDLQPYNEKSRDNIQIYDEEKTNDLQPYNKNQENESKNEIDQKQLDDEEMTDEMILRESEKYEFHLKLKQLSNSQTLTTTDEPESITVPNYSTIVNALRFNSLSNPKYAKLLDKIIETMKEFKDERIILLMSSKTKKFKGIYILSSDGKMAEKLWGKGPNNVKNDDVSILYKYSDSDNSFDVISSKSFNQTTDGFSLINNLENESW